MAAPEPREPVWVDAFALEFIARAVVVELGVAVRLPSRLRVLTRRTVERREWGPRRGAWAGTTIVRVPGRAEDELAAVAAAPCAAWRAGERDRVALARVLYGAVGGAPGIRGDRGFLAAVAVLFFLEVNGWLASMTVRDFILRMRRLARGPGPAAAGVLEELVDQRAEAAPS